MISYVLFVFILILSVLATVLIHGIYSLLIIRKPVSPLRYTHTPPKTHPVKYDTRTLKYRNMVYYPWIFSKSLRHSDMGFCTKKDGDVLINVFRSNLDPVTVKELGKCIDEGALFKLEGLQSAVSGWIKGCAPSTIHGYDLCHQIDHLQSTCDMVELYEMSMLRDTPLYTIQTEGTPGIKNALAVLNAYLDKKAYTGPLEGGRVTGKVLFRGIGKGESIGPYVSQLLMLSSYYNNTKVAQKYQEELDVEDSVDTEYLVNIQRCRIKNQSIFGKNSRYIYSGRMLGSIVHKDALYWAYYNASLILLKNKFQLANMGGPETTSWTDQGVPDLLSSIADVSLGALRCAWYTKYNIGLRIRPEIYALRIDQLLKYPELKKSSVFKTIHYNLNSAQGTLDRVSASNRNNSHLLKLMYPEGSPCHPSYPAGHAMVAGACVTVMKAFFKTHGNDKKPLPWGIDTVHSLNGNTKVPYLEPDGKYITLCGELNKLGSNMSHGRNFAGVHYRSDSDMGMILGEKFAICYLQSKLQEYYVSGVGNSLSFDLEKLNGDIVHITADSSIRPI